MALRAFENHQPAYQQGTVTKVTQSITNRTIPDVSFVGGSATPVEIYDSLDKNGPLLPDGGTSLSAPCWAGLVAIADQGLKQRGQPALDTSATLQTALYDSPLAFFHDITSGFNGDYAGPGYDLVTGIGTPKANLLVPALAGFQPVDLTSPGNQSSVEGAAHTFSLGSYVDYGTGPVKYDVNWGDNSPDLIVNPAPKSASVSAAHTYSEEGTYLLKFTVTDTATNQTASYTITISVSDPAVVATGKLIKPVEGQAFTQAVATFVDPGGPETVGKYSASIDWGDGTPATVGVISRSGVTYTVTGTHTYVEESSASHPNTNPYLIKVTIHHDAAPDTHVNSTAEVFDASLTATGAFEINATEEKEFSAVVATFTDGNANATVGDFTATIFWGDGHSSAGIIKKTAAGAFEVRGTHTYPEEGDYAILVQIKDDGGSKATAFSDADVDDEHDAAMLTALATANLTKKSTPWLAVQ